MTKAIQIVLPGHVVPDAADLVPVPADVDPTEAETVALVPTTGA